MWKNLLTKWYNVVLSGKFFLLLAQSLENQSFDKLNRDIRV